jgi:hypothetical protein
MEKTAMFGIDRGEQALSDIVAGDMIDRNIPVFMR